MKYGIVLGVMLCCCEQVKDEEGVTITVEFTESESVSSGANVTLLVGQMEQDVR